MKYSERLKESLKIITGHEFDIPDNISSIDDLSALDYLSLQESLGMHPVADWITSEAVISAADELANSRF